MRPAARALAIAAVGAIAAGAVGCRVCPPKVERVGPPCADCEPEWKRLVMPVEQRPVPLEIAPWLAAGGTLRMEGGARDLRPSFDTGVEGTFTLGSALPENCAERRTCERPQLRLGPWVGIDATVGRTRGEAGLAFDLGGPLEVSWSTLGVRLGAGYATTRVTDVVGQLSWGTRFVRWRRREMYQGGPCPAVVAPVSGLRLYAAARRDLDGPRGLEVTLGIEWRPFTRGAGIIPHDVARR